MKIKLKAVFYTLLIVLGVILFAAYESWALINEYIHLALMPFYLTLVYYIYTIVEYHLIEKEKHT